MNEAMHIHLSIITHPGAPGAEAAGPLKVRWCEVVPCLKESNILASLKFLLELYHLEPTTKVDLPVSGLFKETRNI